MHRDGLPRPYRQFREVGRYHLLPTDVLRLKHVESRVSTIFIFRNAQHMVKIPIFFHNAMLRTFQCSPKLASLPVASGFADHFFLSPIHHLFC